MNEQEIKKMLYTLYVLLTYKKDEKHTELEFNSLMISSIGTIDANIKNKEQLIQLIKNKLNFQIEHKSFLTSRNIDFKIGDIITTSLSSSRIHLKFVFANDDDIVVIDVFEKGKKILKINL